MFRLFKKKKIIIGIHGLSNKPSKNLLKRWWKRSIREGMRAIKKNKFFFQFDMAYWAHIMYPKPLSRKISDEENPLFIDSPYTPSPLKKEMRYPSKARHFFLDLLERLMDYLSFSKGKVTQIDSLSEYIIKTLYNELDVYYQKQGGELQTKKSKRKEIQNTLKHLLLKNKEKDILLIAHSMGSIIAYDVLKELAEEVSIHTLITIGSPLGLPYIQKQIIKEQKNQNNEKPQTPENILYKWYNFSDLNDKVAINYNLGDDYAKTSKKIKPIDFEVFNDYQFKGEHNYHKSFGYLRTPELSRIIVEFLATDTEGLFTKFQNFIKDLFK